MAINSTILSNVYNYYQIDYATKASSRFDTHKKSELKSLYHSIVNQSKEEPVFLLRHSQDIERYTIDMKESAMEFQRNIANFGGMEADSLFNNKVLFSSDESLASADYINDSSKGADIEPSSIYIESLAKPQVNKGYYLDQDFMGLKPGSYSFDVTTNTSSYELQFSIGDNDTNINVQTRLARLINNSGIGLGASISTDNEGKSALSIFSLSNGSEDNKKQPFSVSDENTSQQRGIVDYLGIRNASQDATWASYSIDGENYTSPDNRITVAGRYQITLKGVSKSESDVAYIGTKPDYDSLRDTIYGIVDSYNKFLGTISDYLDKQPRTSVLLDNMKRMSYHYKDTLDEFGIEINDDATLSIDGDALSKRLTSISGDEPLKGLKDYTASVLRKVNQVQLNPMDYVDKRVVAYKDPTKSHFANPYVTSAYSGMLFNGYM